MTNINKLRVWYTDMEVAHANFTGPAFWTADRPERPMLDKARDIAALMTSFVALAESAMMYRDSGEEGDEEEQVAIEAAELALQYCEELLRMTHNTKRDREIAAHLEQAA